MASSEILAVGARPYTFADRAYFFGRSAEQERLAERLATRALTVMSASSGNGKSSLIEAGLLPQLMRLRLASVVDRLEDQDEEDPIRLDPVPLVVRQWTAVDELGFAETFRQTILDQLVFLKENLAEPDIVEAARDRAEDALAEERGRLDAALRSVEGLHDAAPFTIAQKLADDLEVVVLIFDQMEEVLRNPTQRPEAELALEQMSKQLRERVRLLISFRSDIPANLMRSLERRIYLFSEQIQDLPRVTSTTALKDFLAEARRVESELGIPSNELTELLRWLCLAVFSDDSRLKTLEFNAALWALVQLPIDRGEEPSWQGVLDAIETSTCGTGLDCMKAWLQDNSESASPAVEPWRGEVAEALAGWALERRLSELMSSSRAVDPRHAALKAVDGAFLVESFGPIRSSEALDDAVDTVIELFLTEITDSLVGPGASKVAVEAKRLQETAYEREFNVRGQGRLSPARLQAAGDLSEEEFYKSCFAELLYRLTPEVLKRSGGTYELTHDRLGPALQSWAESHVESPGFKVRVSHEGYAWSWPKEGTESDFSRWAMQSAGQSAELVVAGVSWNASKVQGRRNAAEDTVRETVLGAPAMSSLRVVFAASSLRRTLFTNCVLRRIDFRDCDLTGVIFEDCLLDDVTFERCAMVGAEFRGGPTASNRASQQMVLNSVTIQNSWARGTIIRNCELSGCQLICAEDPPRRAPLGACNEVDPTYDYGFYYMIIDGSVIHGDLEVNGRYTEEGVEPNCNWKGGAVRNTTVEGALKATDVDMTAFAFESLGNTRLLYTRCKLTAAVWIGDGNSLVSIDIDDSDFPSAVFRGVRFEHMNINMNGTSRMRLSWGEGVIFRGGSELRSVSIKDAELDGLHIWEKCSLPLGEQLTFERCSLMRVRFSDVKGEGAISISHSVLGAWQHDAGFDKKRLLLEANTGAPGTVVTYQ